MTCKVDEKILHYYFDNELGADIRARISDHLQGCDECRNKIDILRLLRRKLSGACSAERAPSELRTRIIDGLQSGQPSRLFKLSFVDNFKLRSEEHTSELQSH